MRVRTVFSLLLSCLILLALRVPTTAAQYPQTGPETIYAIKAGKLVDPEKGTAESNQIVVVRGKKIEAVGPHVAIPADAKIIDLSKSTVLPGLFDAHTHLCMTQKKDRDGRGYYFTTLLDPTPYRAIEGVANARDMLAAGFTTVRDVGNAGNYADTALRQAIERGLVPGPTMINAGRIIAPYGGQFHLQPEKRDLATPEYAFADTHDEMIKAIRENIHVHGQRHQREQQRRGSSPGSGRRSPSSSADRAAKARPGSRASPSARTLRPLPIGSDL